MPPNEKPDDVVELDETELLEKIEKSTGQKFANVQEVLDAFPKLHGDLKAASGRLKTYQQAEAKLQNRGYTNLNHLLTELESGGAPAPGRRTSAPSRTTSTGDGDRSGKIARFIRDMQLLKDGENPEQFIGWWEKYLDGIRELVVGDLEKKMEEDMINLSNNHLSLYARQSIADLTRNPRYAKLPRNVQKELLKTMGSNVGIFEAPKDWNSEEEYDPAEAALRLYQASHPEFKLEGGEEPEPEPGTGEYRVGLSGEGTIVKGVKSPKDFLNLPESQQRQFVEAEERAKGHNA